MEEGNIQICCKNNWFTFIVVTISYYSYISRRIISIYHKLIFVLSLLESPTMGNLCGQNQVELIAEKQDETKCVLIGSKQTGKSTICKHILLHTKPDWDTFIDNLGYIRERCLIGIIVLMRQAGIDNHIYKDIIENKTQLNYQHFHDEKLIDIANSIHNSWRIEDIQDA